MSQMQRKIIQSFGKDSHSKMMKFYSDDLQRTVPPWEQIALNNKVLEQQLIEESQKVLAVIEAVKLDRPELLNFPEVQQAFELFTEAVTLLDAIPGKKTNVPKHRDKIGDLFRQGWELLEPLGEAGIRIDISQYLETKNSY